MNLLWFCWLSFFFFIFSGCGVKSIYNPSYYSETTIDAGLSRVTFQGGSPLIAGDLCLLRCAEVTIKSKKKYFEVVDSESGNSIQSFSSYYPFHRHQVYSDSFIDDHPFVTKTIRMSDQKPDTGFAYEAEAVESSIARKYGIDL